MISGFSRRPFAVMLVLLLILGARVAGAQSMVREDLRIGEVNSSGPLAFHQITAMAIGPGGEMYVANRGSTSIRAFASSESSVAPETVRASSVSSVFSG
jgi:hypothetical protein